VPRPSWLDSALALDSSALKFTTGNGDVTATIHIEFPTPHLAKEGPIDIPAFVPFIGGKFGVLETFANVDGNFSSLSGSGALRLSGQTGFTVANKSIKGTGSGAGAFLFTVAMGFL